ncbi:DUF5130 family protein [Rhodococcus zopfii]|uniref:DUF5130 family protein n=1 Tax=Rhodococcus zopfii TaxID=43772 RepID=UPI0011113EDF|nr:DUF5130 family protein [Rhodococcus zopfii]
MASGDVIHAPAIAPENLPYAAALTASGRISRAIPLGESFDENPPFAMWDLVALDDALTDATRATKVRFNVYIADAVDPASATDTVFPQTPDAADSVLIAVYPNQRSIQIRSGRDVADRVTDRVAQLGVTAAVASFGQGQLLDGLVSAIRVMSNAIVAP